MRLLFLGSILSCLVVGQSACIITETAPLALGVGFALAAATMGAVIGGPVGKLVGGSWSDGAAGAICSGSMIMGRFAYKAHRVQASRGSALSDSQTADLQGEKVTENHFLHASLASVMIANGCCALVALGYLVHRVSRLP